MREAISAFRVPSGLDHRAALVQKPSTKHWKAQGTDSLGACKGSALTGHYETTVLDYGRLGPKWVSHTGTLGVLLVTSPEGERLGVGSCFPGPFLWQLPGRLMAV